MRRHRYLNQWQRRVVIYPKDGFVTHHPACPARPPATGSRTPRPHTPGPPLGMANIVSIADIDIANIVGIVSIDIVNIISIASTDIASIASIAARVYPPPG